MTNHVPTLETCQKLKEAGFSQETEFHWLSPNRANIKWHIGRKFSLGDGCAAPLLTEILEGLPENLKATHGKVSYLHSVYMERSGGDFHFGYQDIPDIEPQSSYSPAEAAALLWLELNKKDRN
jgi:hypothetical protein